MGPEELLDLRNNSMQSLRSRTAKSREVGKSALKKQRKKGQIERYLNNQVVKVDKKDKCLKQEKESKEDKAKTTVELYVIGIGRGGRHAVKMPREQPKPGPRSHD